MKLIVGLGNPGRAYSLTRHNIGFRILKSFAKDKKIKFKKEKTALFQEAKVLIKNEEVILALPLTYMNLSGRVVKSLVDRYRLALEQLAVVHDDMDLELGRIKFVSRGSSGGHRGIKSIIECLGTENFVRLKVGIGRPKTNLEPKDFVLSKFSPEEEKKIQEVIKKAKQALEFWVLEGIERTMNIFNAREKK